MQIGVLFGNPETTSGGRALKFYSSVRLDMRRVQAIKQAGEIIGNRTKVRVVKNKVAPPFKAAEFDIMYNEGISWVGDVLDVAAEMGLVEKRGAFYSYGETRLGQGRENAKEFLRGNRELTLEIENKVRETVGLPQRSQMPPVESLGEVLPSSAGVESFEEFEELNED
jgi:recombination protein RecA